MMHICDSVFIADTTEIVFKTQKPHGLSQKMIGENRLPWEHAIAGWSLYP